MEHPPAPSSRDQFDRDGLLLDAIELSRLPLSLEQLLEQEARLPVLELHLAHCRDHRDALLAADGVRGRLVGRLATRIGLRATLESLPPQALRPIERPQIVTGLPRTGTTLLFNLLALRDGVRSPRLWELLSPVPPPRPESMDDDPRIVPIEQSLAQIEEQFPELRRIHALVARAPEECTFAMHLDFLDENLLFSQEIPAVAAWTEAQDFREFYRHHQTILQLLGLHFPPDQRWVLKSPFHLFHLPELRSVYPDAELIFTHRRLAEVVSSAISLLTTVPRRTWRGYDPKAVAPAILERLAAGWRGAMAARDQARASPGAPPAFDCHYERLIADPIGVVRDIESHFGRDLSAAAEDRMRGFLAENPNNKHGKHEHSLVQYGLEEADLERAFADYSARYLA